MKEIAGMLIVLTLISGVCGFLLGGVNDFTKEKIKVQVLNNVMGPAVKKVLAGSDNDMIKDRVEVDIAGKKCIVFIGKKGGKAWAMAYETSGKGFGGNIGVVTGYNIEEDTLTGIGITLHKETPGVGSKVAEDSFTDKFKGLSVDDNFKLSKDGGKVDAISGATISSTGVSEAMQKSVKEYKELKSKVIK